MEIVVTAPSGATQRHLLADGAPISIGRDPSCDLVLEDLDVSRRHATIQCADGIFLVLDRSSNGTYVNGEYLCQGARDVGCPFDLRIGPFALGITGGDREGREPESACERGRVDDHELRKRAHRLLLDHLDVPRLDSAAMNDAEMRPRVREALAHILKDMGAELPASLDRRRLIDELSDEALGLGPLESLLADGDVSEIMVVDPQTIFCERHGRIERTPYHFTDDESARAVIERIVTPLGRRIDESAPYVDARLRDGSRVNAVIGPVALGGTCITIRKFSDRQLELGDLVDFGSMTDQMARFLERSVRARKNILISGGTGSGKTTLLNVLSAAIADNERVVTIEDAAELSLSQSHVVSLESRPPNMEGEGAITIRDLVKNALRMRPDRIVVGECRGGEALDMLQAMNTGHDGSMTTTHANSPAEAVARLETLVLMAGLDLPTRAIREQIAASIDLVVQQTRFADGARRVTNISEVTGIDDDGRVELEEIFVFTRTGMSADGTAIGRFRATGILPGYLSELIALGLVEEGEYL